MPHKTPEARAEYQRAYRERRKDEIRAQKQSYWKSTYRDTGRAKMKARYDAQSKEEKRGRSYNVWRRYHIDPQTFEFMLILQDHKCRVCGSKVGDEADVDHDHSCCPGPMSCGKCVRGLLCRSCNRAMGGFKDDPERLRRAADYIEEFRRLRTKEV